MKILFTTNNWWTGNAVVPHPDLLITPVYGFICLSRWLKKPILLLATRGKLSFWLSIASEKRCKWNHDWNCSWWILYNFWKGPSWLSVMGRRVLSDFVWNRFLFLLQTEVKVFKQTLVTLQQSGMNNVTTHWFSFFFLLASLQIFHSLTNQCGNSKEPEENKIRARHPLGLKQFFLRIQVNNIYQLINCAHPLAHSTSKKIYTINRST